MGSTLAPSALLPQHPALARVIRTLLELNPTARHNCGWLLTQLHDDAYAGAVAQNIFGPAKSDVLDNRSPVPFVYSNTNFDLASGILMKPPELDSDCFEPRNASHFF